MRHSKKFNHLSRTAPHRKAMLSNMAASLIVHKRITTTVAKAKALRKYVEPLITKSKSDTTHSRRVVFSYLQDKVSTQQLFDEVADKVADRPGGYTRIIKLGNRLGDNAEMALIELVDYNSTYQQEEEEKKTRTRRSRRGGKKNKSSESQPTEAKEKQETAAQPEEAVEEKKEEKPAETEEAQAKPDATESEEQQKPEADASGDDEEKEEK